MALSYADTAYAIRFLRLLTMPFTKTDAFKTGIIDKNGKKLPPKSSTGYTPNQKAAYTIFHRLVFNIRRILLKVPIVKGTIANYLTALYLVKEHTKLTDQEIGKVLSETFDLNPCKLNLSESLLFINNKGYLTEGTYTLNKELLLPTTAEPLIQPGTEIIVKEDCKPIGKIFGVPVFKVQHMKTKNNIYVTEEDINNV